MEALTTEQAKLKGYKYATPENGEGELIALSDCEKDINYFLVSQEGEQFTISEEVIKDLVDDYLCNQDEVSDEDGVLNDLAEKVDYSDITMKLNEAFSVRKYFHATNIRLVV